MTAPSVCCCFWQHAAELLMQAHKSGKPDDIAAATGQLRRALSAEGWIK
jgi:hypothetical protein